MIAAAKVFRWVIATLGVILTLAAIFSFATGDYGWGAFQAFVAAGQGWIFWDLGRDIKRLEARQPQGPVDPWDAPPQFPDREMLP